MRESGAVAPVVFVLLYAVLTVLLLPGAVITAAGGVVFGTCVGTVLSVIGATIGAAVSFVVARRLAGSAANRSNGDRRPPVPGRRLAGAPRLPRRALRPAGADHPVQRAELRGWTDGGRSACLHVRHRALGIVPGAYAFAALGGSFDDPTSPEFITAVVLLVTLAVGVPLVNRVLRRLGCDVRRWMPSARVGTWAS